jgi:hypothetical protein
MTKFNNVCQYRKLEWGPASSNIKVGSNLNGKRLPNNESEDFRGISLCPLYSNKQLRKILRIKGKTNNRNRKSQVSTVKTTIRNKSHKEVICQ